MRIELFKTSPDRSGRYTVRFEDGTVLRLYRQTIEDFGSYTGKDFTEEEFQRLHQEFYNHMKTHTKESNKA